MFCCQVHVFEKYPDTLLNTMIRYNMNKHSGSLFQKSNFSPPGMINFSNFFITPPKTFHLSLGVAGKTNTDFVRFVTILPILPLCDRTKKHMAMIMKKQQELVLANYKQQRS